MRRHFHYPMQDQVTEVLIRIETIQVGKNGVGLGNYDVQAIRALLRTGNQ